jgi:hypothetical protein
MDDPPRRLCVPLVGVIATLNPQPWTPGPLNQQRNAKRYSDAR